MSSIKKEVMPGEDPIADAVATLVEHTRATMGSNYLRVSMLDMVTSDGAEEDWTVIVVRNEVFRTAITDAIAEHVLMERTIAELGKDGLIAMYEASSGEKH